MNRSDFIKKIATYAVEDYAKTGVPASLTIAQAALESAWGTSGLTRKANNLFGIKGAGPAGSITMPTKEYVNKAWITVPAPFRAYHNWGESIADHSALMLKGVSWNRGLYLKVLHKDGKTAAHEVAKAGYATDPNYASKLISIMDMYNLYQYDTTQSGIKEEDQPMTAEEKKKMDELEQKVQQQAKTIEQQSAWIGSQKERINMPCPKWAQDAYNYYKDYIADETGSYDFWRQLVISYRKEKGIKIKK